MEAGKGATTVTRSVIEDKCLDIESWRDQQRRNRLRIHYDHLEPTSQHCGHLWSPIIEDVTHYVEIITALVDLMIHNCRCTGQSKLSPYYYVCSSSCSVDSGILPNPWLVSVSGFRPYTT